MATTPGQDQNVPQTDQPNVDVIAVLHSLILPQGFGFRPTDGEIITQYLVKKVFEQNKDEGLIHDIDNVYDHNPEDLSEKYTTMTTGVNPKWYFYTARDNKTYSGRSKYERVTTRGYWIPTAGPRTPIMQNNNPVGFKKKFNFYFGRQPQVQKSDWSMVKYYSLGENQYKDAPQLKDLVVLYKGIESDAETSASADRASSAPEQAEQLDGMAGPAVDRNISDSSENVQVVGSSSKRRRILGRDERNTDEPHSED